MGGIFSKPQEFRPPEAAAVVEKAPTAEDPAIKEAKLKAEIAARKARGRASTILTSGRGVTDEPLTGRKILTGE